MTRSKVSPAATRLAASTPPTDSMAACVPDCCAKPVTRSARTWRVAMEEMPRIKGAVMRCLLPGSGWPRLCVQLYTCCRLWAAAAQT
ncbi:hypothetical protein D3C71_1892250 [compost metagenome]